MKRKRNIYLIIIGVMVIIIIVFITCLLKQSATIVNNTYTGYLYDEEGNIISEDVSVSIRGEVKGEKLFYNQSYLFQGDIIIDYGEIHNQLEGIKLSLVQTDGMNFLLSGMGIFLYKQDTELGYYDKTTEYENIGVTCWDTLTPHVVMIGLGNEYCEKYNVEKGAVIMVSSEQREAEELWKKRAEIKVDYLDGY